MKLKKNMISRSVEIAKIASGAKALKTSSDPAELHNARIYLKERLGRLRGLPQKIGQIMSMASDEEVANDFEDLTDSFEPFPFEVMVKELEKAWGFPISQVLKEMDAKGHPASLGQVHKAVLKDGREIAIKIRYPGIKEAVMNDLKMLGWLTLPVGSMKGGFNIKEYQTTILEDLNKELDYIQEAKIQIEYKQHSKDLPFVIVPEIYLDLVRENILVSSWHEGMSINEVQAWPSDRRRMLANRMLEHFVHMFFVQKMIHADPHPGNYRFVLTPDGPQIVIYDFGCVYNADQNEDLIVLKIIKGCTDYSNDDPYKLFLDLGFNPDYLEPIQEKLPALTKVIFEPFLTNYAFDFTTAHRKERVQDILGKHQMNFRMAGPAQLIFLIRAFSGLEFYVQKLGVDIMWKPALNKIMDAKQGELRVLKHTRSRSSRTIPFSDLAKNLYVEVKKDGKVKAELIFPLDSVDDLENIMDGDVVEKVNSQGISLPQITKKARANGYRPMDLFKLDDDHTNVRVWLA